MYDSNKKYRSLENWFCPPHLSLQSIPSIISFLKPYTLTGMILPSDSTYGLSRFMFLGVPLGKI